MKTKTTVLTALAVVVIGIGSGLGISALTSTPAADDTSLPTGAVQTSFPDLAAAEGAPELASIALLKPRAGEVLQAEGPFDDRFVLEYLGFDGTTVSGAVSVTSDVSELLELEVLAGFYGADGKLLGTDRFVHHLGGDHELHEGPPELVEDFSIAVPAEFAGQAVSASVGVPVLVNE